VHDAVTVLDQMDEHVEHLRLDGPSLARDVDLAEIGVDHHVVETVRHQRILAGGPTARGTVSR
jgi:hypothetical protein